MWHFGVYVMTLILGSAVFVPLLVIALVRLRSPKLAFAVSGAFSMGAMLGFMLSLLLGIRLHFAEDDPALLIFASAGTIGGAALAMAMIRRLARHQDWRR